MLKDFTIDDSHSHPKVEIRAGIDRHQCDLVPLSSRKVAEHVGHCNVIVLYLVDQHDTASNSAPKYDDEDSDESIVILLRSEVVARYCLYRIAKLDHGQD